MQPERRLRCAGKKEVWHGSYTIYVPTPTQYEQQEKLDWKFTIVADGSGIPIKGRTNAAYRRDSKAVRWTEAILGRELSPGEQWEWEDLRDLRCIVNVEDVRGHSRVTDVHPAEDQ
jgi:hypothetical protein